MATEYEGLLADLEALNDLRKAQEDAVDLDAIEAAAAEGDEGKEGDGKEGDADLTKSLTLENGEKVSFVDGTELVKAMGERLDAQNASVISVLRGSIDLIKAQGADIAALKESMAKLLSSGSGRRSVAAAPAAAEAGAGQGMTRDAFLTKARAVQGAGKLSASDVAIAEGHLNAGIPIPDPILRAVFEG